MNEKPEALRLADDLKAFAQFGGGQMDIKSANELCRQHAEIERLRGLLAEAQKAVWMNYDCDLLARIEAALKEVPR
jgi:hypothetical protein